MNEGWPVVRLGQICGLQNGFAFKSGLFRQAGVPVLRISSIQNEQVSDNRPVYVDPDDYDENLARYRVVQGDLLIAMSGGTTGKIGFNLSDQVFLLNQRVGKFQPTDDLDIRYLYYFLSTKAEENLRISAGAAQPNLSTAQIKGFLIPLPPVSMQKRIVTILDEAFAGIDAAIANTEKNLANARELFESYLNSVFSDEFQWPSKNLEEVVESTCKLSYGIVQPGKDVPHGLPVVRPTDLSKKNITLEGLKRIDPSLADSYQRTALTGNELLLCVRGSTGVISISTEELKGANVTRGIVPIRFEPSLIDNEFGYYSMCSPSVQRQIKGKTYGAALMQINIRDVRKISLKVPALGRQKDIVSGLDDILPEIEKLESIYTQKLKALTELKQSLLQKAFTGELTVENMENEAREEAVI